MINNPHNAPAHFFRGRLNPTRDWFVLLTLAGLGLLAILAWSVWTFQMALNREDTTAVTQRPPASSVVDQSLLEKTRTLIRDRATEETKYETGAYRFTDPSQ